MTHHAVRYRTVDLGDVQMFYREAGSPIAPVLLLLHGFPTSSHMYRNLIPQLARDYRVLAPDLPGFGSTTAPPRNAYAYTFENLFRAVQSFVDVLQLDRFALMVFDYGAPVGFRLAAANPRRISAVITQNGNAYEEGLREETLVPMRSYWDNPNAANREALRPFLTAEITRFQYTHGVPEKSSISSARMHWRTTRRFSIAIRNCSSICSATTRATSSCIRIGRITCARSSRPFSQSGGMAIRSSARQARMHSARMFLTPRYIFLKRGISPWRPTGRRSQR